MDSTLIKGVRGVSTILHFSLPIVTMKQSRQAVTKLKIRGNAIPYMDTTDEINTIYCMPFVPVSYFVTACRTNLDAVAQVKSGVAKPSKLTHSRTYLL